MVLQERCRKDPLSYKDDFITQKRHFDALLSSACLRPSESSPRLTEVSGFMGTVAHCYGETGASIAPRIAQFLSESGSAMNPELRRALVRLLGLLRAKGSADAKVIIPLFFKLLACNDKILRRMLHGHIVADIKKMQASGHSGRKHLQTFLFSMVEDPSEVLVKRGLHVLIDLFRKKIWNDAKCANMIASACFHPATPVSIIASRFLLDSESKEGIESDDEEEDEEDKFLQKSRDGQKAADMWKMFNMTGKKTSKKRKRMERVINRVTRVKSNVSNTAVSEHKPGHPALEAMILIYDPQDFSERLFHDLQHRRKKESYENRLLLVNLISRLVGTHELLLFNFYPFLQRYLQPAQPEVTRVLAYLTQACHDKVPPDVLHPILRGLADSFVSERSSPPSVAAGINTIRAICSRVPLAIFDDNNELKAAEDQEAPLLEDLVQYKSDKDKGVMMASRSLIALYREVHPGLLHKRDRGRAGSEAVRQGTAQATAYGEHTYATGVEGVELLLKEESEEDVDSEEESDAVCKQERSDLEGNGEENDGAEDNDSSVAEKCLGDEKQDTRGAEEQSEPAIPVDTTGILSNEDFAKIRARRAAQALGHSLQTKNSGQVVDPDDIQGPLKRERRNLEERLESVIEGREGREKFGSKKGLTKGGGSTNKQKLKTKSNSMVIHKRRRKTKQMSRRDKQISKRRKRDYK